MTKQTNSITDNAEIEEYPASDADTEELEDDGLPSEGEDTIEVYDEEKNPVTKKTKLNEYKENNTNYHLTANDRMFQGPLIKFKSSKDKPNTSTIVTKVITNPPSSLSKS